MTKVFELFGYAAASVGLLVCLVAGVLRVTGAVEFMNFEPITLLQGGMALMIAACMARLYLPRS